MLEDSTTRPASTYKVWFDEVTVMVNSCFVCQKSGDKAAEKQARDELAAYLKLPFPNDGAFEGRSPDKQARVAQQIVSLKFHTLRD